MEEAEKLLGRKLKQTEKTLINLLYDETVHELGVDSKGDLVLNKKS